MHSKVHSMRVCFVRPRNFPAMSIFFPQCQDLLCEAAGFCACCERTNNFCLLVGVQKYCCIESFLLFCWFIVIVCRLGVFIINGFLVEQN